MVSMFKKVLTHLPCKMVRRFRFILLFAVFSGLFETVALGSVALFVTFLTSPQQIIESGSVGRFLLFFQGYFNITPDNVFWIIGGAVVVLNIAKNVLISIHSHMTAVFDGQISQHYGDKLLHGSFALPSDWQSKKNSSDIIQIFGWKSYCGTFATHVMTVISDLTVTVFLLSSLFFMQPLLSLSLLIVLGLVGWGGFSKLRKRMDRSATICADEVLSLSRLVMKGIQGNRDLRLFAGELELRKLFNLGMKRYVRHFAAQRVYEKAPSWILESAGLTLVVSSVFIMRVLQGDSIYEVMGVLSLLVVSAWRLLPGISRVLAAFSAVRGYRPYIKAVIECIEEMESAQELLDREAGWANPIPVMEQGIEVKGAEFTYEEGATPALSDIKLSIKKGECIGFIGRSGGGKSTLMDLLTGLVIAQKGTVEIDGVPLGHDNAKDWMQQVGVVPQTPYLFHGTLAENVAFSLDPQKVDRDQVYEVCRLAGVDEFLESLPNGIDTIIGERGIMLSGGQAQRVSIARALYRKPEVLIFDEATSALDADTEALIRDTVINLQDGRTVLIVAHRMTTVNSCNRLICMEDGRIVNKGTPASILGGK